MVKIPVVFAAHNNARTYTAMATAILGGSRENLPVKPDSFVGLSRKS